MAQYTEITIGNPLEVTDNIDTFRFHVSSGNLQLEKKVGITWEEVEVYTGTGFGIFRVGVRSLHWVIDEETSGLGFSGVVDVDWVGIEQHKLA